MQRRFDNIIQQSSYQKVKRQKNLSNISSSVFFASYSSADKTACLLLVRHVKTSLAKSPVIGLPFQVRHAHLQQMEAMQAPIIPRREQPQETPMQIQVMR